MTVLVNNTTTDTLIINDDETHIIGQNGVINEVSTGVNFDNNDQGALLYIAGLVATGSTGVSMDGNDEVVVAQTGHVVGTTQSDDGFGVGGDNNEITIAGTVEAPDFGIFFGSTASNTSIEITETGLVHAGSNSNGNEISSYSAAIGGASDVRLVNNGDIFAELNPDTGRTVAFAQATGNGSADGFDRSLDAEATIINSGTINGDVIMGAGDDTFIARGEGAVFGRVSLDSGDDLFRGANDDDVAVGGNGDDTMGGGAGDDNLNGNNGADSVFGGDGDDVLNGAAGLDVLRGNAGDDTLNGGNNADQLFDGRGNDLLSGGAGNDTLTSGGGDDTLNGGDGLDTFDFNGNFGSDRITNFSDNNGEQIDLRDVASITSFNDLSNNHLSQDGADAVIDAGNGNVITIQNFNSDQLDSGDFIF